jgi:flavin reductase (DIM6/NTAB) family NADH-FMN oxidoreductase RutF
MNFTKQDLVQLGKVARLNLINSVTGIKPANLIGTKSNQGETNLGIFSSVVHLGSDPALIGFILRPQGEVPRHTFVNLLENGFYTINHVPVSKIKNAHYTSAKFDKHESEFDFCDFEPEYLNDFWAPFVKESPIKMGLRFVQEIQIPLNGTSMVIGEIEALQVKDELLTKEFYIDLERAGIAGISGLNNYYSLVYQDSFPYARRKDVTSFKS